MDNENKLDIYQENKIILKLTEVQYDYLLLVVTGLVDMEKKIPKKVKTKNSATLLELFELLKNIDELQIGSFSE